MIRRVPLAFSFALVLLPLAAQETAKPQEPAAPAVNTAIVPVPREGAWKERHDKINADVAAHRGDCELIFIGDSITQGWEGAGKGIWKERMAPRHAVNLGISGDRTEHVLWRFENGNLEGIAPKAAVVMIGTNNFGHGTNSPEQVLEGVRAVVQRLRERLPGTKILLLGIFPRGDRFNEMRGNLLQVNQALSRLNDGEQVFFADIGAAFVEDDGSISKEIMPDALHLSAEGYQRWADAIEPWLVRLLAS